ncbi:Isocitrate lyase [Mycena indigotica]|uniref:Isocitrate lyase n=1 Tax=Mycena indigotica TaxID=2126181 RepID=A0A8H6SYS0_9AGAR|nr:Isocitrate lyase [Mycena indigotica]KAF7306777.1 Isocitrate lyase [Mycena indigotica]
MRPTRFYSQDIVRRVDGHSDNGPVGIVMRHWLDEDVVPHHPDPLMRPLLPNEVGCSFYRPRDSTQSNREFDRQILPESQLRLIDRSFHPGDFCKRSVEDTYSGVVLDTRVQARCEHVMTGERIKGWVSLQDTVERNYAEVGDLVAYQDWVGQVIEVCFPLPITFHPQKSFKLYDEVLVETSSGEIVRVPEIGSRLSVGERGADILPPPASAVHSIFGFILGNNRPSPTDTCLEVTHTVYAITWLAISQELEPEEAAKRQRPPQFWKGPDISKLTLLRSLADLEMRVGDRIVFKDDRDVPSTTHGLEGATKMVLKTFIVTETRTFVDVLWQDGSKSENIRSIDLIPYLNPDEYDCWPGDWVVWNTEDGRRPVIVQSVSPQRTASVRVPETGKIELASVLELDTHGASDTLMLETDLGVRRGDFVFVHPDGRNNGAPLARVPRIGEVESWVRDPPLIDNQLAGFRKDMSEMGADIAHRRAAESIVEGLILRPSPDNETLMWIGEVTNVCLDGTVDIAHPNGSRRNYPLHRLTKLYDGIDQLEDGIWDEMSEGHHPPEEEEGQWDWATDSGSADGWGSNSYEGQIQVLENQAAPVEEDEFPLVWPDSIGISESDVDTPTELSAERVNHFPHPDVPRDAADESPFIEPVDEEDDCWKRFQVLSTAPVDHAYYASPPAQPTKLFMNRLSKEFRALESSLPGIDITRHRVTSPLMFPDSILVRAYEDRVDLLRCMIIGPENTPYSDAPFIIDWCLLFIEALAPSAHLQVHRMLDSNFPHSPPMAHFLSWTNGNGRGEQPATFAPYILTSQQSTRKQNPVALQRLLTICVRNLYEEGKVCLSILGTWAGDRNEIWSAARSSLLQAFVSIQGLVLVKEPWFCEPAYEKLRGTEEGIVNSRLYSEKAYVLSRGFVRRALELPPGGLETEIEWLFYRHRRLEKVIEDAQMLVEKSKANVPESEEDRELAVPRLSAGGIITLDRTLNKLVSLRRS